MITALPDRPILDADDDLLGRSPFANNLADLIANAPLGATLRIGVYGGWGEGKTSVLALMYKRLKASGLVCVWLMPWVANSEDEFAVHLVREVAKELDIELKTLKATRSLAGFIQRIGKVADLDYKLKLADIVGFSPVRGLLDTVVRRQEASLHVRISEALAGRKLVVFVDDLDRVQPALVPKLLLTLREVLDRPSFFYVMGLAPNIVERGLRTVHEGWGAPNEFLEKIIEFPAYLPTPSQADLEAFLQAQIERLGSTVDASSVRDLGKLLPRNPRKLKLLLRYLASLHPVMMRFAREELDWRSFYLIQLLKIEFPRESRVLAADRRTLRHIQDSVVEDHIAEKYPASASGTSPRKRRPENRHAPRQKRGRRRFLAICEALRRRTSYQVGPYSIAELFAIPEVSPAFTLREADALYDRFKGTHPDHQGELIVSSLTEGNRLDARRTSALWNAIILLRRSRLEAAASVEPEESVVGHLQEADALLVVLRVLITNIGAFRLNLLSAEEWFDMLGQFAYWAHFGKLSYYEHSRLLERNLLLESIDYLSQSVAENVFDPTRLRVRERLGAKAQEFETVVATIVERLQWKVAEAVLSCFERRDCIKNFWTSDGNRGAKFVLFKSDSTLHKDTELRARLSAIARRSATDIDVRDNFLEFFRMLTYGAFEGGGSFGREECRQLAMDVDLVALSWSAAVVHPLNPRTAGSLREDRGNLIAHGIPAGRLPTPPWWDLLEKEFFQSGTERSEKSP